MQRSVSTALLQQLRRTIARYQMFVPGDRVLVAVSGGPDSVALLAALAALPRQLRIELCAAHFNHQLRGEESRRDQRCAQMAAERLGVRCVVGAGATLAGQPNLEARAREQRYAFLAGVADAERCTKIATAHTMDDQAETVLMRLLRGAGWDGLAGIQPVREGRIIRPMIECSRQQVLVFLKTRNLPFCEDSSNSDRRFLRNRVRHDVLPVLRSINPNVVRALASTAQTVGAETELLEERVRSILQPVQSPDGLLAISAVAAAPPALRCRVVRAWLRQRRGSLLRLTSAHVRAVVDLALGVRPNARVRLPGAERVVREYAYLRWQSADSKRGAEPERVLVPGSSVSLDSGWCITAEIVRPSGPGAQVPKDLWELAADAEALAGPLVVRSARPGDHIRPLGMQGRRKLQDIFVDRKLPQRSRWSFPVVESAGEILWVPGVVRSRCALISSATRSTLRLAAQRTGIAGA